MWKNHNSFVLLAAAIMTVSFAANLQAEMVYVYDFNDLTLGDLCTSTTSGQDNWRRTYGSTCQQVTSGATGWDGKYVEGNGVITSKRANNTDWSFSIDPDMPFDCSARLRIGGISNRMLVGWEESDESSALQLDARTSDLRWLIGGQCIAIDHGIPSTGGEANAKTFLAGALVSPQGTDEYLVEPYYQNLTDGGEKQFVTPATISALSIDPGNWSTLRIYTENAGGRVDDFRVVSQIPEPGSLALAGIGLIGLLCYAWRKRK